jgi:Sulfotransferase domain
VVKTLCGPVPGDFPIWYQKHLPQHVTCDMQLDWLGNLANVFLIRDPDEMVASFAPTRDQPQLWELEFEMQMQIFDHVSDFMGKAPPVIDGRMCCKTRPACCACCASGSACRSARAC